MPHALIIGTFSPLHSGHEHLIKTAFQKCDQVTIGIYDSADTLNIPLTIRANWLRALFPKARVSELWDWRNLAGDSAGQSNRRTLFNHLVKRAGVTQYFTGDPEDRLADQSGIETVVADPHPKYTSAFFAEIRENPYLFKDFIDPIVYKDLIIQVVFLGAPSTGKSTLAERLSEYFRTVWMPEYGGIMWMNRSPGEVLQPEDFVKIAEGHLLEENKLLLKANKVFFTDTDSLTTLVSALYFHGHATPRLMECALEAEKRYDLVFVCDTDTPDNDGWGRSREINREVFQSRLLNELHIRKRPYIYISGDVETRMNKVIDIINRYRKFTNYTNLFIK